MTVAITPQGPTGPASDWAQERRATVRLAGPMILSLLGFLAMEIVDILMIGRLGEDPLAAVSLGVGIWYPLFLFGMAVVSMVAPLAAQAMGARNLRQARRVLRQGLWVGLTISVPMTVATLFMEEFLLLTGQEPRLAALAQTYLTPMAFVFIPTVWWIALRCFMAALDVSRPAMWIVFAAVPLNAGLNYLLIYGNFGFPRLELLGAGLATLGSEIAMLIAVVVYVSTARKFKRLHLFGRLWKTDWATYRRIFRIGLPAGGIAVMEATMFSTVAILMGWFGATALAVHLIATQICTATFTVPMGLSQAAAVRIGQAAGRGDLAGVRRAGWTAFGLGWSFMACGALVIFIFAQDMIPLFVDEEPEKMAELVALGSAFLYVAVMFQLADAGQVIAVSCLRGLNDTVVPMIISFIGYWVFGLGSGCLFAFYFDIGGVGLWYGLLIGLSAATLLGVWRFHLLTRTPDIAFARIET